MEEKMESEQSYSGESSSSSESSSGSSESEEEMMEPVRILGHTLELPQELCEDYSIFREFFSMKTWDALEDEQKEHLKKFLPKFPENDAEEKEKTVKMLFNHEPFHFISPFDNFFSNLRQGNYRPDIAKMRKFLLKARAKQRRHKIKSYYAKLLPEVLISRERLLAAAKACPPGPVPRLPLLPPKPSSKNTYKPLYMRARQRYFEELTAIRSEVGGDESEDDNYPEGPPERNIKKKRQMLTAQIMDVSGVTGTLGDSDAAYPNSLECLKNVLAAHRTRRQYRESHPELHTVGITLDDIKQRVAFVNGTKKLMFGGQKSDTPTQKLKRGPKKDSQKQVKICDPKPMLKKNEEQLENVENRPLLPNIKIKCEQVGSDSESSSFGGSVTSPKQQKKLFDQVEIKQEVVDMKYPNIPNMDYSDPKLESVIKQEPLDPMIPMHNTSRIIQPVPIKLEDLDGIDMMALPVEIADDSGEVVQVDTSAEMEEPVVDPDEALTETTHANFLSLVRALFPARAAHRASKQQLYARCAAVIRSPIAPLNTWYSLSDDWCAELDSALEFLAGERGPHPDDFVPYLQFMPDTQMYQWIGAGRDCDSLLGRLCDRWLRATSPPTPPPTDPPGPKYPTLWVVRPPTNAEIVEFRTQERRRFAAAAKPFTYLQHGYRSVVGPCARASVPCAAAGALLTPERPRHANFLALVRDAVARLPNGEGSRHDVLTLLKMSQWIGQCSDHALLAAVSSALDRLHSAKRDPMVKFDQKTAVWTYLHRHRSEEEWVRVGGARARGGRASQSSQPRTRERLPSAHAVPHAMDLEVGSMEEVGDNGSDTDVDVDDSSSPSAGPHLSSAQLLMQATQSTKHPSNKSKGKLVAVSPQKSKSVQAKLSNQAKLANLMSQAAKQANLMSQSAKQASLMAQAAKQASLAAKQSNLAVVKAVTQVKPAQTLQSKQSTNEPKSNVVVSTKQTATVLPVAKEIAMVTQAVKQTTIAAQTIKQAAMVAQNAKHTVIAPQAAKQTSSAAQAAKQTSSAAQAAKQTSSAAQAAKQTTITAQAAKHTAIVAQAAKQTAMATQAAKQTAIAAQAAKQTAIAVQAVKQTAMAAQAAKQASLMAQSVKQANVIAQLTKPVAKPNIQTKVNVIKQLAQSPKATKPVKAATAKPVPIQSSKQDTPKVTQMPKVVHIQKASPTVVTTSHKSPLIKQRPLMKQVETTQSVAPTSTVINQQPEPASTVIQPVTTVTLQSQNKVPQGTRSLLIRPQAAQTTVTAAAASPAAQMSVSQRRGVVRVLSPAASSSGKSLISPRALMQQGTPTTKKRTTAADAPSVTTLAQSTANVTSVVSSVPTVVTSAVSTRTVQLAGGRTVQLAANQTVHLPGGQAVQLTSGHTLQLSSLQLPTHSVRLPSGQTVQLASPQAVQAIRSVSTASVKSPTPRPQQSSPTVKPVQSNVQIPISTVQLAGQTVHIGGQTVQLAGQSVQLTGHTVKLPSGQSVQVASQSMLPSQSVQLPSGQTVQIASGNVQLGQNVLSNQTVQMPSGQSVQLGSQTVHLGGQTVQLAGQTVQLPGGQTVQLPSGQTVQLSSGQTLQLSSGQTVQIANPQTTKPVTQIVRHPCEKSSQPIVAKLLTNAQGQMISLESAVGSGRALQVSGVRVLSPAARVTRPLLLTTAKPLHNIILQQSDGSAIRVTSSGGAATSQTIVLSTIGAQTVTTSTTSTPVLKLQQVNQLQQVKLPQGIKLQQVTSPSSSVAVPTTGVRSVLMDGQQLKLVGGRHVLARILRPAHPPPQ